MKFTESNIQIACVNWFRMQYPKLGMLLFSVPNGGLRAKKVVKTKFGYKTVSPEGKRLRDEGSLSGVADIILLYGNGKHNALALEMKTKSGRQTENQKRWQKAVEPHGVKYSICKSFEDFEKCVNEYLADTDFGKFS